ncbi:MAG: hypothetical protein N2484_11490 [Clostridia bacterium]|nr:hypothetical protein [Clostridia bacterium]
MKTTIILGAGFSKNSNIPIQSEIPKHLIHFGDSNFDKNVSEAIFRFLQDLFGYEKGKPLPNLDDIFTCIDISTSSGHHLGLNYSPVHLRAIRRLLVYRVFSIIEESFCPSQSVRQFLKSIIDRSVNTSFIVLNWDTALEKYLKDQYTIEYCCWSSPWSNKAENTITPTIPVIKVHGSCNWLYCDNCRTLFHDIHNEVSLYQRTGFKENDFKLVGINPFNMDNTAEYTAEKCLKCGNEVSSHISTFRYRKSFRANSFPNIWNEAEKVLTNSDRWIFVGYSLPDADYEFKHLLKISELKLNHIREHRLEIDAVLLNSKTASEKYKKLFGNKINKIYNGGIEEYLKEYSSENL